MRDFQGDQHTPPYDRIVRLHVLTSRFDLFAALRHKYRYLGDQVRKVGMASTCFYPHLRGALPKHLRVSDMPLLKEIAQLAAIVEAAFRDMQDLYV